MIIQWYGLIVGIATIVWWSLAEYLEPKLKKVIPLLLVTALVGARGYHVLEYWGYYQADLSAILRVWEGGLSIWGAIIAGLIVIKLTVYNLQFTKEDKVNFFSAIVTPLPLAQAIGRVANGVNGEFGNLVLGIPWWGMEAILNLGLFGLLGRLKKEWRVGGYLVGYLVIRLVLSPYR